MTRLLCRLGLHDWERFTERYYKGVVTSDKWSRCRRCGRERRA